MPATDTKQPQRRNRELAILNAIAQALNRSVDLNQALQAALAQVAELLDLQTGWIWLLSEETGESYLAAAQNLPPALADNPRRMEGSCYCLDTYHAGDLDGAANVNVVTCSRLKGLLDGTAGLLYHASIPLYAHGKELGVLNVASPDWRELAPEDLRLLYTVGDLLGIAIERARLFVRSAQLGAVEERNRLAREIHDTLAQGLSAIALRLETADALMEARSDPVQVSAALRQALDLTRSNLEAARRSVLDLRAAPLEGRSLAEALQALANRASTEQLTVRCETVGRHRPLPVRVEVGLYRIAQEALNNVTHHAEASLVTLRLVTTPEQVELFVQDDGRGFDPSETPQGRYGLVGMNERVRLLGGTLGLESSPGEGTRVRVLIPLE
jgi:two-component system NarL family sensor kinase